MLLDEKKKSKHLLSHSFSGSGFGNGLAGQSGLGSTMKLYSIHWVGCSCLKARLRLKGPFPRRLVCMAGK